jgi:hypothetical protein
MQQVLYLNNHGSRWVIRPVEDYFIVRYPSGEIIKRRAKYFESFGNYAAIAYSYKGRTETSLHFSTNKEEL